MIAQQQRQIAVTQIPLVYDNAHDQDSEVVFTFLEVSQTLAIAVKKEKLYIWEIQEGQLLYEQSIFHDCEITALCLLGNQDIIIGDENGVVGLWKRIATGWQHEVDYFTKHKPILSICHILNFDLLITETDHEFKLGTYSFESAYVPVQEITQCSVLKFCEINSRRNRAIGVQQNQLNVYVPLDGEYICVQENKDLPNVKQIVWISENKFATAELNQISVCLLESDLTIKRLHTWYYTTDYMLYNSQVMKILLQNAQGFQILEFEQEAINVIQDKQGDYLKCKMSIRGEYILTQNKETRKIELFSQSKQY